MLRNQEICNFLNDNLSGEHTFKIFSEIGTSNNDGAIQGVLTRNSPQMTPLSDVIVNDYSFTIELSIPAQLGNKYLESVEKTINNFAKEWNGKEYAFESGKGTLHFNLTSTGSFNTSSKVGNQVPLVFGLTVVYTEDVVTSLNKHWLLDGVEIPFISEDVMLEKEGITKSVQGKQYKETLLTGQTKFYHFRMYFKEGLATTLHQDILQGDFEKTYTLEYYDGVSFTKEVPFETTVSIFRSANANSEKPKASILDIVFSDVDDGKGAVYEFALLDTQFDNQSENTMWFESETKQRDYFERKIVAPYEKIKAPNLDSLDITNQVYRNTSNIELFNLTNKNYAIIRVTNGNDIKYFYYFVTNAMIGANNQVSYDLKLDSIQTYYFNENIKFEGSFIQKAHLDRWIDNYDGTIEFDCDANSYLFEREQIQQVAKRLVDRKKLILDDGGSPFHKWISDKVLCWVYVYCSAGNYNVKTVEGNDKELKFNTIKHYSKNATQPYEGAYTVFCYPVYKKEFNKIVAINDISYPESGVATEPTLGNKKIFIDSEGINGLRETNNGFTKVFSIKLSLMSPFDFNNLSALNYYIDDDHLYIKYQNLNDYYSIYNTGFVPFKNDGIIWGLINVQVDRGFTLTLENDNLILPRIKFDKVEIVGQDGQKVKRNAMFNPKLNSMDYKTLTLSFGGNTFEYDIQKINNERFKVTYNESLSSDATKCLIKYFENSKLDLELNPQLKDNNIYNSKYEDAMFGLMATNDLSLPIADAKYDQFMANNKNAYVSMANQIDYQSAQYAQRSASNIVDIIKNPLNVFSETQQIANDTVSTALNMQYQMAQFNLSMDNMKSAPDSLRNANGNAIFLGEIAEFGVYAEIYEGLPKELEIANNIMYKEGFTFNQFANVKDYDNIRKYFNYIRATIDGISGVPMSNTARFDIRYRFAGGVRFWNMIDGEFKLNYEDENYEKKLDREWKPVAEIVKNIGNNNNYIYKAYAIEKGVAKVNLYNLELTNAETNEVWRYIASENKWAKKLPNLFMEPSEFSIMENKSINPFISDTNNSFYASVNLNVIRNEAGVLIVVQLIDNITNELISLDKGYISSLVVDNVEIYK